MRREERSKTVREEHRRMERAVSKVFRGIVGDDAKTFLGFVPEIEVREAVVPFAYAATGPRVVLSTGLIRRLADEDELAFVLAHELGHLLLHHEERFDRAAFDGTNRSLEVLIQSELAADRVALRLLEGSPFSADSAAAVLAKLAGGGRPGRFRPELFPSLARRIRTLQSRTARSVL
jgi:Zn-dependent protease with chaperone function